MIKTNLRTEECWQRYLKGMKKDLHDIPVKAEWDHWKLVKNEYPYDNVFDKHDMLILKGEYKEFLRLSEEERLELSSILGIIGKEYDGIYWPFQHTMTYPSSFHLHLTHTMEVHDEET